MNATRSTFSYDQVLPDLPGGGEWTAGGEATVVVDSRRAHFFEPGVTGMMNLTRTNELAHALQ